MPLETSRNHIALTPLRELPAEMTQQAADVLGMTEFDFRLRYRGWIPRSMAAYRTQAEAEKRATKLNAIGIATLVYNERDLPQAKSFLVRQIDRPGAAFEFKNRRGETVLVPWRKIALMVCGKRVLEKSTKECSVEASSIAVGRYVKETTKKDKTSDLYFMFFTQGKEPRVFEISQRELDFACLGPRQTRDKVQDFTILQSGFQQLLAEVPVDDRLLTGQRVNRRDQGYYNTRLADESSLANATLIYWERMAQAEGRLHFTAPEGKRR